MKSLLVAVMILSGSIVFAEGKANKKVTYRKTQEVSFDGSDVDGVVRSPDGSYLVQKQGVKFMPLYKVNKQFEKSIKDSIEYLR